MSKFELWAYSSTCYYKMSWKQDLQLLVIASDLTPNKAPSACLYLLQALLAS